MEPKFILYECTCKPDEAYVDGTLPQYHTDRQHALKALIRAKKNVDFYRYWGIHLDGLHILSYGSEFDARAQLRRRASALSCDRIIT